MTLAEIVAEGERQLANYQTMILPHGDAKRLLAVAKAGDRLYDYAHHAPICTGNHERPCDCGLVEAVAAWDAASGGQPCGACKTPPPADAAPRFRADLPAILPQRFAKTPEAAREAPPADAVAEDVEPRHELKTWPEPFAAVLDGRKRFEIRKADRPYTDGDVLLLREWDPKAEEFNGAYTGRSIKVKVTYRVRPGMWGLSADTCVLGIVPLASPANAAAEAVLSRIESACGHPDPAEACRNVLALCREARVWDREAAPSQAHLDEIEAALSARRGA